jgi:hypothetical protein
LGGTKSAAEPVVCAFPVTELLLEAVAFTVLFSFIMLLSILEKPVASLNGLPVCVHIRPFGSLILGRTLGFGTASVTAVLLLEEGVVGLVTLLTFSVSLCSLLIFRTFCHFPTPCGCRGTANRRPR